MKPLIQLPPQNNNEILAGGIQGLYEDMSPSYRNLGVASSIKNLIRTEGLAVTTRRTRNSYGDMDSAVLGMGTLYNSDGDKYLVSGAGSTLKYYDGETWDTLTAGLTSGYKFNTATFDDFLLITNGKDPVKMWDGSDIENLGGSPPVSPFIETAYRRVFLVDLPHILRCSDVAIADEWTALDSAAIPINAKDGDEITWIRLYKTNMYIWKRYGLFELHGPELGYVTKNWRVFNVCGIGTPNGRTVSEINGTLYWLSDSRDAKGIVAFNGGRPQVISQPVSKTIKSINWANIDKACAGTNGELYFLSVPTDTSTTPNTTIVFDTKDNSWWVWDIGNPLVYGTFMDSGTEIMLIGDSDGNIYKLGGGEETIDYEMVIGPTTFGVNTKIKRIRRLYVVASLSTGASMNLAASNADSGSYGTAVSVTANTTINRIKKYLPLNLSTPGSAFCYRLKISGKGSVVIHEIGVDIGIRGV